jgi:hypothetical protein
LIEFVRPGYARPDIDRLAWQAWLGKAGFGTARLGLARQAWQGSVGPGASGPGLARRGMAGEVGPGMSGIGLVWRGRAGKARVVAVRPGLVGLARQA